MLEIFFNAVNSEHFFKEGFPADSISAVTGPISIAFLGVYLSEPTCIPVAGSAYGNLWMNATELEPIKVEGIVVSHSVLS